MKRYVLTAAVSALCLCAFAPSASAKSAIVIVVENNQKAANDADAPSPLVLDSVAVLTEGMLHRVLTREMNKEIPAREVEPKQAPSQKTADPDADPDGKRKDEGKRAERKPAKKQERSGLQKWIGSFMPDFMSDGLEPNLDKFGEPFYARLLELAAARYWDRVVVLTDDEASFDHFAKTVRELDDMGYLVDVMIDIHGGSAFTELGNSTNRGPDKLYFTGKSAKTADVVGMGHGKKLNLNTVYSVACWGSRFNEAWVEAGATAANGSRELNYYVLVSPIAFLYGFGQGLDLQTASDRAYEVERRILDRRSLDQALAPMYGRQDVTRVQTAASSSRVQKGPAAKAACHND